MIMEFRVGEYYTNDQVRFSLGVENLGGIRPSVDATKNLRHLVLITTAEESPRLVAENPYHDRIEGDILLYTAQGRTGDQELAGRNRRLIEQYTNPVPFYGFINEGRQSYRFLGLLELLRHYPELQIDTRGKLRKVWLFEFHIHNQPDVVLIGQGSIISASLLSQSRDQNQLSELEREVTALPMVEMASERISGSIETESIRSRLFLLSPYRFEHLVRALMEVSGFTNVSVTSASGDGGIDVNGWVDDTSDFFAGTHVQAQVKRWRHAVGSVEINKFRGALSTTAKGVFVTTSHYTRAALIEARHESKLTVTLIDGPRLSSLIIKSNLDVESYF